MEGQTITVTFLPENISVAATAGEGWLSVAERAGVDIPTGCRMGSCGVCTVALEDGEEIRTCISSLGGDRPTVTAYIFSDPTW